MFFSAYSNRQAAGPLGGVDVSSFSSSMLLHIRMRMRRRIDEKWLSGIDREGEMATSQLHRLNDVTSMLLDMLSLDDELPSWVQSKITRAYTDLNDVFGYLEPRADGAMTEGRKKKKKRGLWANVHARRKAGKRPLQPGEKGYPKSLET